MEGKLFLLNLLAFLLFASNTFAQQDMYTLASQYKGMFLTGGEFKSKDIRYVDINLIAGNEYLLVIESKNADVIVSAPSLDIDIKVSSRQEIVFNPVENVHTYVIIKPQGKARVVYALIKTHDRSEIKRFEK